MTNLKRESIWLRAALRAYPPQWRATREPELLSLLHDTIPDGPHWPGLRALCNLVASGWRTRLRLHPPLWRWLGYRFFGAKLPPKWHVWTRSDIRGRWWWLRRLAVVMLPFAVVSLQTDLVGGWRLTVAVWAAILLLFRLAAGRQQDRWIRKYAPDPPEAGVWTWGYVWQPPPVRMRVTSFLVPMGALLSVGAAAAAWAILYPSSGSLSKKLSFEDTDTKSLGHAVPVTWGAVAFGLAAMVVAFAVFRRRVPTRLATRAAGVAGAMPALRPSRSKLVGVLLAQLAIEAFICAAELGDFVPGIVPLQLVFFGGSFGPLLIALGVVARRSELALGIDVTGYDCQRAVFGKSSVIAPEVGTYLLMPYVTPQSAPNT